MVLLRLLGGFAEYCCFICLWDSQAAECYCVKDWPVREKFIHTPLVDPHILLLPLLCIKCGLMKNSVKLWDKNSDGSKCQKQEF